MYSKFRYSENKICFCNRNNNKIIKQDFITVEYNEYKKRRMYES
jgi:hypothetical protein